MKIDNDKIDEAELALVWLTLHDGARAWKGFDWDALGRLHRKGMIDDPGEQGEVRGADGRGIASGGSAVW